MTCLCRDCARDVPTALRLAGKGRILERQPGESADVDVRDHIDGSEAPRKAIRRRHEQELFNVSAGRPAVGFSVVTLGYVRKKPTVLLRKIFCAFCGVTVWRLMDAKVTEEEAARIPYICPAHDAETENPTTMFHSCLGRYYGSERRLRMNPWRAFYRKGNKLEPSRGFLWVIDFPLLIAKALKIPTLRAARMLARRMKFSGGQEAAIGTFCLKEIKGP